MKQIVGRKMGMTQVFAEDGTMYPVSVIEVLPNVVSQVKKTAAIKQKKESSLKLTLHLNMN